MNSHDTDPAPPHPDCVVIGDAGVEDGWQEGDHGELPPRGPATGTPLDPYLDQIDDFLDIFNPPGAQRGG